MVLCVTRKHRTERGEDRGKPGWRSSIALLRETLRARQLGVLLCMAGRMLWRILSCIIPANDNSRGFPAYLM